MKKLMITPASATGFILLALLALTGNGCTKYEDGFLSPYFQYPISEYSISKGRTFTSDAINPDGSSIPFTAKLLHVYDEAGKSADDVFFKTYPVKIWTASFNAATDTTLELINSKRTTAQLPAVRINEKNGAIEANEASFNLPAGRYSMDIEVSNKVGTQILKNVVKVNIVDAPPYETIPDLGTVYNRLFLVGDESVSITVGVPSLSIERTAETPDQVIFKILDKNGRPFNPAKGEIVKRPNSGLNPVPPFLQNFEAYTHAYTPTDTAMLFPFAVTPMPQESLGNGYNMYYRIPSQFVHIDGYPDDTYSCNPRLPVRIWLPGTYEITMQLPDVTHR